jgi:nitroreductase
MEVSEAIIKRRSIRQYKEDAVKDEDIKAILEAGRWAPSWANTQCARFVVVRDADTRKRVAESLMSIKLPDRIVENPGAKAIRTTPVTIAVCAAMKTAGLKPGGDDGSMEYITDKGDWFMFDTALAVQNMSLEAFARGLGTVIIGAFDANRAEKALGVPDGYRVVVLMPVGVPAKEPVAPPRKQLSEIVFHDTWK